MIASNQPKQIERLYTIFEDKERDVQFTPVVIELGEGFVDPDEKLLCYTDHQIFERYHRFRLKKASSATRKRSPSRNSPCSNPATTWCTSTTASASSGPAKAGRQRQGTRGHPPQVQGRRHPVCEHPLAAPHQQVRGQGGHRPQGQQVGHPWNNLKKKTKSKVKQVAFDLLKLYAKRKTTKGFAYTPDTYLQHELEASFIYEDTPDQETATEAIKKDMEAEYPMDRLAYGDVGFETELAVRAAFKAVADGKQVAVLVPTTILSLQHYKSFKARLAEFPCRVDYLNRFKTAKQKTETFKDLEAGKIDILIGTHAIVGKRVKFKDLGLLVIDEEQKFGVAVKDKLKTLKAKR